MKTMERMHHEVQTPAVTDRQPAIGRRTSLFVLVAVLALILGAVGGWVARGFDGGSDPAIVLAGDGELTARQEQMVDMISEGMDAWRRGDSEAAAAMFTDHGIATFLGTTYRVDDNSFQEYVEMGSWASLGTVRPLLVRGDTVLSFHTYQRSTYTNVFEFTTEGELLIEHHTISS